MDAAVATDERGGGVRRRRVVLTPRGDGGKKAVHRGEHAISRKAIAQGRPECSPLNLYARVRIFLCANARETAGAARTRSSRRPLFSEGANEDAKLGRHASRDREVV